MIQKPRDVSHDAAFVACDRLFTLETATRTLPLVRVILQDLTGLYSEVVCLRERLETLRMESITTDASDDVYAEELAHVRRGLERDSRELERYFSELEELGVSPRDSVDGAVGFPAVIDGRLVELSWILGEEQIAYFQEVGDDPTGRKPLIDSMVS